MWKLNNISLYFIWIIVLWLKFYYEVNNNTYFIFIIIIKIIKIIIIKKYLNITQVTGHGPLSIFVMSGQTTCPCPLVTIDTE